MTSLVTKQLDISFILPIAYHILIYPLRWLSGWSVQVLSRDDAPNQNPQRR